MGLLGLVLASCVSLIYVTDDVGFLCFFGFVGASIGCICLAFGFVGGLGLMLSVFLEFLLGLILVSYVS